MVEICRDLKAQRRGCAEIPDTVPKALDVFMALPWQDTGLAEFSLADLRSVYRYVRGSTTLEIPDEWRPHTPRPDCFGLL